MRRAYAVGPVGAQDQPDLVVEVAGEDLARPDDLPRAVHLEVGVQREAAREAGEHVLAVGVEGRDTCPDRSAVACCGTRKSDATTVRPTSCSRRRVAAFQTLSPSGTPSILPRQRTAHPAGSDDARVTSPATAPGAAARHGRRRPRRPAGARDGLRTALGVGVPLLVGIALDRPLDGLAAAGGAFSAGFALFANGYRTRLSARCCSPPSASPCRPSSARPSARCCGCSP